MFATGTCTAMMKTAGTVAVCLLQLARRWPPIFLRMALGPGDLRRCGVSNIFLQQRNSKSLSEHRRCQPEQSKLERQSEGQRVSFDIVLNQRSGRDGADRIRLA